MKDKRLLIINTGGTIGMVIENGVLIPKSNALRKQLSSSPQFHDSSYKDKLDTEFITPALDYGYRVRFDLIDFPQVKDSSNMEMNDWIDMAKTVAKFYESYDGFVILHGTDTMAYSASALSFMIENLGKPVIFTGSQLPLYPVRSDAANNLLGAMLLASHFNLQEVGVFFHQYLFRGNRVTKVDSFHLEAFTSPNFPPLIEVGITIKSNIALPKKAKSKEINISTNMENNVGILRIFPGISNSIVENFVQPPLKALILQTYGSGNGPDHKKELLNILASANKRGVITINCSQCLKGKVTDSYESSNAFFDTGMISAYDMTVEAALTKISFLLGQKLSNKKTKELFQKNLRGEISL